MPKRAKKKQTVKAVRYVTVLVPCEKCNGYGFHRIELPSHLPHPKRKRAKR